MISLTKREKDIIDLLTATGASNKVLARRLGISESTVKLHITHLLSKFCCSNRSQLIISVTKLKL